MRRSREETARTRERIIEAASEEFREHGIVGTGLAELMKAAGLTHGGFYKHFTSKDELVREVAAASIGKSTATMRLTPTSVRGERVSVRLLLVTSAPRTATIPGTAARLRRWARSWRGRMPKPGLRRRKAF